jgi:hypothetical protein
LGLTWGWLGLIWGWLAVDLGCLRVPWVDVVCLGVYLG